MPHRLYHNLGGGKFEDVTAKSGFENALGKGMGISIADFNEGGWLDVFIADDTERNFLYVNQKNDTASDFTRDMISIEWLGVPVDPHVESAW